MEEKVEVNRELKIKGNEILRVDFIGGKLTCRFINGKLAYGYLTSDNKPRIDQLAQDDYNWDLEFGLE